jgi:predicted Zn-dependent protease
MRYHLINLFSPRLIPALAVMLAVLSGCSTYNPATGRNEFIMISTQEEVAMGEAAHKQIIKQFKISQDDALIRRVQSIGRQLASVSDRQDYKYQFFALDEDELNAFTVPGGRIYVFSGLAKKLPSDDALAAVLAHEIGHCAARHTIKKFQAALGYNIIGSLILSQVGESAQTLVRMSSGAFMNLVFSAYGRQDEYQADLLGLKYMNAAGYRLEGMVETLEVLQKASQGPQVPLILRTHPYADDRIKAVKTRIGEMRAQTVSAGAL